MHSELGQPGLTHVVTSEFMEVETLPPTPSGVFVVRQQVYFTPQNQCILTSFYTLSVVLGEYTAGSVC